MLEGVDALNVMAAERNFVRERESEERQNWYRHEKTIRRRVAEAREQVLQAQREDEAVALRLRLQHLAQCRERRGLMMLEFASRRAVCEAEQLVWRRLTYAAFFGCEARGRSGIRECEQLITDRMLTWHCSEMQYLRLRVVEDTEHQRRDLWQQTMLLKLRQLVGDSALERGHIRFAGHVRGWRRLLYEEERLARCQLGAWHLAQRKKFSATLVFQAERWARIALLVDSEQDRRHCHRCVFVQQGTALLEDFQCRYAMAQRDAVLAMQGIQLATAQKVRMERERRDVWQRMVLWSQREERWAVVLEERRMRESGEQRALDLSEIHHGRNVEQAVVSLRDREGEGRRTLRAEEATVRGAMTLTFLLGRRHVVEAKLMLGFRDAHRLWTQQFSMSWRGDVERRRLRDCRAMHEQHLQERSVIMRRDHDMERLRLAQDEFACRAEVGANLTDTLMRIHACLAFEWKEHEARHCAAAEEDARRRDLMRQWEWQNEVENAITAATLELTRDASPEQLTSFAFMVSPFVCEQEELSHERLALEATEEEDRQEIVARWEEHLAHKSSMLQLTMASARRRRDAPFEELRSAERHGREGVSTEFGMSVIVLRQRLEALQRQQQQEVSRRGQWFRVATQNLQHSANWDDVTTMMETHGLDICILTEVNVKGDVAVTMDTKLSNGTEVHIEAWPGPPSQSHRPNGGVGVAIRLGRVKQSTLSCKQGVREDGRPSDRILVLRAELNGIGYSFIGAYSPVESSDGGTADAFYSDLSATWAQARGRRMILGDLNARVPSRVWRMPPNNNGERLLEFVHDHDVLIGNLLFPKRWQSMWTMRDPFHNVPGTTKRRCLLNDYALVTKRFRADVRDLRVVQSGYRSDHKLVVVHLDPRKPKTIRIGERRAANVGRPTVLEVNTLDPDVERLCDKFQRLYEDTYEPEQRDARRADWTTDEVVVLSRQKAELFRKLQQAKADGNSTTRLSDELRVVQRRQKKAVRTAWNDHWARWAGRLDRLASQNAQGEIFKLLRPLYRRRPAGHLRDQADADDCAKFWEKLYSEPPDVPATTTILPPAPFPAAIPQNPPGTGRKITAYTDGGAVDNGKPNCVATWGVHFPNGEYADRNGRAWGTPLSNNRGEICAAVIALETVEVDCDLQIKSDSKVLAAGVSALKKSAEGDFCGVEHGDLFRTIYRTAKLKNIKLAVTWVKGHSVEEGPDKDGNDAADKLCTLARRPRFARDPICGRKEDTSPVPWTGMDGSPPDDAELRSRLCELHNNATGMDKVQAATIQRSKELQELLFELVRLSWDRKVLPAAWRRQLIVAIPKKAGASAWDQHRGIALLSHAGKLMARVILERMRGVPMLDVQHGFRRGHSTTLPILGLKNILDEGKRKGVPLVLTFVDVTKAYDWVNREYLFETLAQHGVPENVRTIIRSMYDDEIFMRLGGHVSKKPFKSRNGVRQGCLLSPLFFNLVLDRALHSARQRMRGLHVKVPGAQEGVMEDYRIDLQAYADDTMFVNSSMRDAQHDLNVVADAFASAGFRLSVKKTQYVRLADKRVAMPGNALPALPPLGPIIDATGRREGPWQYDAGTLWYEVPPGERAAGHIACPLGCGVFVTAGYGLQQHLQSNTHNRLDVCVPNKPPTPQIRCPPPVMTGDGQHCCPEVECMLHRGWSRLDQYSSHWRKVHAGANPTRQWFCGKFALGTREERLSCAREIQRYPVPSDEPDELRLYGEVIDRVKTFKYLGRVVDDNDRSHIDEAAVTENLAKARMTWAALHPRFTKSKRLRSSIKIRVFKAVCQSQFVYGSESWMMGEALARKVNAWQARCLRHCTGMQPKMVTVPGIAEPQLRFPANDDVLKRAEEDPLANQVQLQRIREVGRLLRRPADDTTKRWFLARLDERALPHRLETNTLRHASLTSIETCGLPLDGGSSHAAWCKTATGQLCPAMAEKKRRLSAANSKRRADKKKALRVPAPTLTRTL
jgi:ribonuclease HI